MTFIAGVPPIDVVVEGKDLNVLAVVRNGIYSSTGDPGQIALAGADIEQRLDSRSVGQLTRDVCVVWNERSLGCARIGFAAFE
jgi:hypothetical protein